jgi:hypothetical protein
MVTYRDRNLHGNMPTCDFSDSSFIDAGLILNVIQS